MAIIMAPETRVTARAADGRVFRTLRASMPTARYTRAQAVMWSAPSRPVCAATGQSTAGSMN